jgi:hypothetical protein
VEVIKHYEARINKQKQEYLTLEEGFKDLEEGYFELLARYDKTVEALNKLSLRRWLYRLTEFLGHSVGFRIFCRTWPPQNSAGIQASMPLPARHCKWCSGSGQQLPPEAD